MYATERLEEGEVWAGGWNRGVGNRGVMMVQFDLRRCTDPSKVINTLTRPIP